MLAGLLCLLGSAEGIAAPVPLQVPGHLKLIDPLDRPADGYCLDIVGSGQYIRFDMPLTAHNCKPGLYHDEAVVLEANGYIRFPAYNRCLTAAGLNGRALPGAALIPRGCGERSPFLEAERLQIFRLHDNGQVELEGSGLCLTAGHKSDSTFASDHRWRALFLEECASAEPSRSRWQFSVPQNL
ncbi:RICIN domain-containing protein [Pseudomonas stutzeri]|nr:RICIN domain-containing protein [Stutzerimonas stutzeri]